MTDKIHWQRCEGTKEVSHPPVNFARWVWPQGGLPFEGGCPVCTAKMSIGGELKALLQTVGLVTPDSDDTDKSASEEPKH